MLYIQNSLSITCAILYAMSGVMAQPGHLQAHRQGTPPPGGYRFHSGAPAMTIRPTVVTVVSGAGQHTRVACRKGQRLTFCSPQMTQDSLVRLPDGRRGFIHTRDIKLAPGWLFIKPEGKGGFYVHLSPLKAGTEPA